MARPSPRTLGKTVDPETGEEVFFTKFGTQQLKFIDPTKPALGVKQINVGQTFKGITTGFVREITGLQHPFGAPTVRDTAYQDLTITKGVGTTTPPPFPPDDNGEDCDLGCLLTGRGCDCGCKDVKPCTTCDSAVCVECNAWDLQCEDCRKKDGTCTPPETPPPCDLGCWITGRGCECDDNGECGFFDIGCKVGKWWEQYGIVVMIIGGLIGLGILLWLLRPLFGFAKSVTEAKSAVTRVNGMI